MNLSRHVEVEMNNAVQSLAGVLERQVVNALTHQTVIITGWNKDASTRQAIARYLVGLRACAIDAALNIRAELEDSTEDRIEVFTNVIAIIGESNNKLTEGQKQDERNPWIAEGIWHLCLAIAARYHQDIHLPGSIIALNYAHIATKDHGLDVAAIYEANGLFGLSLVESKAYKNNPNQAISDVVGFFREVNAGKHALRIRQTVQIMRTSLAEEKQAQISKSFWKHARAYLPNPHYDTSCGVDWTNARPSFRTIKPDGVNLHIVVMPHSIDGFDKLFDDVADEMRAFARILQCTMNMPVS